MPLFMDLHKASDYDVKPTVEEIRKNHIADLEVQHKYGVKFLQYWINEEAGLVFCLMEAPDKEACAAVHAEAHGAMPCNVIELKGGDYSAYLQKDTNVNAFDIVETPDGALDTGYRFLLVVDMIDISGNDQGHAMQLHDIMQKYNGNEASHPGYRTMIVFTSSTQAIHCAIGLLQAINSNTTELRIAISAGAPVTDQDSLFADAIQLANHLCSAVPNGRVVLSALAKDLTPSGVLQAHAEATNIDFVCATEEKFLQQLVSIANKNLTEPGFSIDDLATALCLSKSGLYRKITELTGYSANAFIQELRLRRAFNLLKNKEGNVAQVAFETGFSNPSYFAKNFQKRFGITPSSLTAAH